MNVILASASPRRRAILSELGIPFEVIPSEADEILDPADPVRSVVANARAKALACQRRFPSRFIIAADTLVCFDGKALGKPRDWEEAAAFLRSYSGKTQFVYTGVALLSPGEAVDLRVEASSVRFRRLTETVIRDYLREAHTLDRAGGYDINTCGERIIESYAGSYTNIMGLPKRPVWDWWRAHAPR